MVYRRDFRFLLLAGFMISLPPMAQAGDPVLNPHGKADSCTICHVSNDATHQAPELKNPDAVCLECHDGVKAAAEKHPVGRKISPSASIPPNWPAPEDKLSCLTCHDLRLQCDPNRARTGVNTAFLRSGGGKKLDVFCRNCHKESEYPRLNPHLMLAENDQFIQQQEIPEADPKTCIFCHTQAMNQKTGERKGAAHLRTGEIELCRVCHAPHKTELNPPHLGLAAAPQTRAYMRARELLGPGGRPNQGYLQRLREAEAAPSRPLDEQGRLICTSCHNPHQAGVFPEASILNNMALWQVGPKRVFSASTQREMCKECHRL